jgi:hypothetical protein
MADECNFMVYRRGALQRRHCSRLAKKDGYCNFHHPEAVATRRKEREDKYLAAREVQNRIWLAMLIGFKVLAAVEKSSMTASNVLVTEDRILRQYNRLIIAKNQRGDFTPHSSTDAFKSASKMLGGMLKKSSRKVLK